MAEPNAQPNVCITYVSFGSGVNVNYHALVCPRNLVTSSDSLLNLLHQMLSCLVMLVDILFIVGENSENMR